LIGIVGLVVVLCVQNAELITLTFIAWTAAVPLWLVVAVSYLLGMFSRWGMAGFLKRSWRRVTEPQTR
jgi:uncharacterized integral membrane protein